MRSSKCFTYRKNKVDPDHPRVRFCKSENQATPALRGNESAIVKITRITRWEAEYEDEVDSELLKAKVDYEILAKPGQEVQMFDHKTIFAIPQNIYIDLWHTEKISSSILEEQWELRKSGQYCDVEVRFPNGKVLRAHKLVLSCNSPTFKTQFTTSMTSSDKDCITETEDIDYIHFKDFLHFLYKGFTYFYSLEQMYDLLHLAQ